MLGNNVRNITPNKNTCRALFGPVDHDEVRELLRQQNEQELENAKERWNFDFKLEKPLPGRYEYELPSEVPSAYALHGLTTTTTGYVKRKRDEELDEGDESKENDPKRTAAEVGEVERSLSALSTPSSSPAASSSELPMEDQTVTDSRTVPDSASTSPTRSRQSTLPGENID